MELLVENGVDVDAADGAGRVPLYYAIRSARHDLVSILLAAGADPYVPMNDQNMNALHVAAHIGAVDVVRELAGLARGRDLLLGRTRDKETPLHIAVRRHKRSCVEALLAAGARPYSVNAMGHTPLHLAAMVGAVDIGVRLFGVGGEGTVGERGGGGKKGGGSLMNNVCVCVCVCVERARPLASSH